MLLCRRRWGTDRPPASNSRSSAFFYAVLLAFVVVAVWADYRDTETAVRNEAKALADLHLRPAGRGGKQDAQAYGRAYIQQVRDSEGSSLQGSTSRCPDWRAPSGQAGCEAYSTASIFVR